MTFDRKPVSKFSSSLTAYQNIERKNSPDDSASVRAICSPWTATVFSDKLSLIFVHVVRGCLVIVRAAFSTRRIESLVDGNIAVGGVAVIRFRIRVIAIVCLLLLK